MDKIVIRGGRPLRGRVRVAGAKNAALPILAATLLAPGEHRLRRVPRLADVSSMLSLLGRIGCASLEGPDVLLVDTTRIAYHEAPYELVRRMRASVLVLGPLLARCGRARVSLPGGCALGVRPIDQHLKGLEALGATFRLEGGYVHGRAGRLHGARVVLDVPTVTGTENVLMAAVLARGESEIVGAAREPEIGDLVRFLRGLGARIEGEGSSLIRVEGVDALAPAPGGHDILPDRIEAGTWLAAGAMAGGPVEVTGCNPADLVPVLDRLSATGCRLEVDADRIRVGRDGPILPVEITTGPHPGFPTDMQAQVMALLTTSVGTSLIRETIFENRFMHVPELQRLGADIAIGGRAARVRGVPGLVGASVMATDLRASASLVLAGLVAEGTTEVLRVYHLDRGYEDLVGKLRALGAEVVRVPQDASPRQVEAAFAEAGGRGD